MLLTVSTTLSLEKKTNYHDERNPFYFSKIKTLIFSIRPYFSNISMLWYTPRIYMLKQRQQRKWNKQTNRKKLLQGDLHAELLNTKARIDFLADFLSFLFSPFLPLSLFVFCFSFFLSFFLAEYWGPGRPTCCAPEKKYAPLGMRLLWKYVRNYFLAYHF